jgi:hypothetical protein
MAARRRPLRTAAGHKLVARRDTLDFRDQMYVPTLVEVPPERSLDSYFEDYAKKPGRGKSAKPVILDQGTEGACTGFGLAAVANFLLSTRKVQPDAEHQVSPWMLYDLARRYDEWPGEDYEGSSARGAMKGWHKHGVCAEPLWTKRGPSDTPAKADADAWTEALRRPLGAYFRVNHKDLVAMHAALTEVGILYATADVHAGWNDVRADGMIRQQDTILGGHAFAIVAFDRQGFWIQNSWNTDWGHKGFGHIAYDDWLANGNDVWVARLGVPVLLEQARSAAITGTNAAKGGRAAAIRDLRRHIVSIGNDGLLRPGGEYGTTEKSLADLIDKEIPAVIDAWKTKKILLYAHGGLVDQESAVQKVANYRAALTDQEVYPISFIWKTDYFTTLRNIVQDALRKRRTEGVIDAAKDFMLDRLDDALEPIARVATGKAEWDEMKENARLATESTKASDGADGGARLFLAGLERLYKRYPSLEVHVVAHSAGAIFMAYLIGRMTAQRNAGGLGRTIATCTLMAPACTMELFEDKYLPAIDRGRIEHLALYTLTDKTEQDDNCAGIYHKSLLYLVSNAFEETPRIPMFRDGFPILGMEKFVKTRSSLDTLFKTHKAQWIRSPNTEDDGSPGASAAKHHGDFDDDRATLLGTLGRITSVRVPAEAVTMGLTPARRRARRLDLEGFVTPI